MVDLTSTEAVAMLASLRQIEARNPKLFQTLVTRAVLDGSGGWELPPLDPVFVEQIAEMIVDDVCTEHLIETITRRVLVHLTAEALA